MLRTRSHNNSINMLTCISKKKKNQRDSFSPVFPNKSFINYKQPKL